MASEMCMQFDTESLNYAINSESNNSVIKQAWLTRKDETSVPARTTLSSSKEHSQSLKYMLKTLNTCNNYFTVW